MNKMFFIVFAAFVSLYGVASYYAGLRTLKSFSGFISAAWQVNFYWLVWVLLCASFFIARIGGERIFGVLHGSLSIIGYYWLAVIYYVTLIWLIIDAVFFLFRKFFLLPSFSDKAPVILGSLVLILVVMLLSYGAYNAKNPQIKRYDVTINKNAGNLTRLHAVAVSDIHLGLVVDRERLRQMVNSINELNPDVVFLPGDVIDENLSYVLKEDMGEEFKRLKPPLGVYAVFGNHEYIAGNVSAIVDYFEKNGVRVLRDEYEKIADSFYIVGREDPRARSVDDKKRIALEILLKGIDSAKPVILLDHQPINLDEGKNAGVDLQFSGHTHYGQIFPNNFITGLIYENDWGYLKKGSYQIIVSSGFGTWGPPVRIGNTPEIVDVRIKFAAPE